MTDEHEHGEDCGCGDEDEIGPEYQMTVFFNEFPTIDTDRLTAFFRETDPEESELELQVSDELPEGEEGPMAYKLAGFAGVLDTFNVFLLVHDAPSAELEDIQESMSIPDEEKEIVAGHKAFVQINIFGGEDYAPYESMILLLKTAMGLCEQGGVAAYNPWTGSYFTATNLMGLVEANKEEISKDEATLWDMLRGEGEPARLLMNIEATSIDDKLFLMTQGCNLCGFPEFIAEIEDDEEADPWIEFFESAFSYLIANDATIEPGNTVVYDEEVSYRFDEAPDWLTEVFPDQTMLLVERIPTVEGEGEDEEAEEGEDEGDEAEAETPESDEGEEK